LGVDPATEQPSHDGRVVDDHDADRVVGRGYARSGGSNTTHSLDFQYLTGNHQRMPIRCRWRILRAQMSPTSWNLASTICLSKGFMMYSLAPACSARAMWATSFSVVQNTTFGRSPPGSRRSTRRKS